jgi:ABC-type glycerol-3-phosphate transport system substrate-binding protein
MWTASIRRVVCGFIAAIASCVAFAQAPVEVSFYYPAAAVARDQLPFAKAELSTHDNQRVTKALNDGLQAALTGAKTPEQAMKDAQREAERLLRPFR